MNIAPTTVPRGPDRPAPAPAAQWSGTAVRPSDDQDDHWSGSARTQPIPDQAPGRPSPALVG
jgi:hypothetical protein